MLELFGESLEGVGFGLGDVTLLDFLNLHGLLSNFETPKNHLFLFEKEEDQYGPLAQLAFQLRQKGFKVVHHFGKIKFNKAIKLAEKRGANYLGFFDQDNSVQLTISNLQNKKKEIVSVQAIEKIQSLIS